VEVERDEGKLPRYAGGDCPYAGRKEIDSQRSVLYH
jgi:hypothetical protein